MLQTHMKYEFPCAGPSGEVENKINYERAKVCFSLLFWCDVLRKINKMCGECAADYIIGLCMLRPTDDSNNSLIY